MLTPNEMGEQGDAPDMEEPNPIEEDEPDSN
jgi:hypothetical protein